MASTNRFANLINEEFVHRNISATIAGNPNHTWARHSEFSDEFVTILYRHRFNTVGGSNGAEICAMRGPKQAFKLGTRQL
jgi:hypothetical protein